jgi:cyclopropane fatty-acyl-phospholipid synthase-like methyltransferase
MPRTPTDQARLDAFLAGYRAHLVPSWLPALDGGVTRLERGTKVADVGCGSGASTILMAQAYPRSRFFAYDPHPESIELARQRAAEAGVDGRVTFEVAGAVDFPGREYDLVCHFDCSTELAAAARRVRQALAEDGTWMVVEPFAARPAEQLRQIFAEAGFSRFRRAARTAFSLVLEARI